MDIKNINNEIESLGIHELRTLARNLRMKSPTTKKRAELIEYIKNYKPSDVQSDKTENKMGRPVKTHSSQEDLLLRLMLNQDEELDAKINRAKPPKEFGEFVFEQDVTDPHMATMSYQINEFSGVLRKTSSDTYYFINYLKLSEKTYVLVDETHVNEHNLMVGDYIRGSAFFNEAKNVAYLKNVITVNGVFAEENKACQNKEFVLPHTLLEEPNFYMGQSKICEVENRNQAIEYIQTRVEKFNNLGIKSIVVALDISIETLLYLDRISGITKVVTTYEDWASLSKDKLIDSHNLANALFNRNNDVVVFVLDILQVYEVLNTALNSTQKYEEEVERLIKKTVSQNRASDGASISVYSLYYSYQKEDYQNEIKYLNKITKN